MLNLPHCIFTEFARPGENYLHAVPRRQVSVDELAVREILHAAGHLDAKLEQVQHCDVLQGQNHK